MCCDPDRAKSLMTSVRVVTYALAGSPSELPQIDQAISAAPIRTDGSILKVCERTGPTERSV